MASAAHPPSGGYGFRPGWHAVRINHRNRPYFGVISRGSPRAAHVESTKAEKRNNPKRGRAPLGASNAKPKMSAQSCRDQGGYGFAAARIAPRIPTMPPIWPARPPK